MSLSNAEPGTAEMPARAGQKGELPFLRHQPLRILTLCYEWPPAGGGGGRVGHEIAKRLVARGHQVRVLTSHVRGLAHEELLDGVSIRRAFAGRLQLDRCSVSEMLAYVIAHQAPALAEARRFRPDVMHVHFAVPTGTVAWLTSRTLGIPYLLTAHLGDVPGGAPEQTDRLFRVIKPLTSPIWSAAAEVTAVSEFVAGLAQKAYGRTPIVIPNGVDMSRLATRKGQTELGPMRAVWVGRMQAQKNLPAGVADLMQIRDLDWTLDLVGDGPDRAAVEKSCAAQDVVERMRFHGWRSPEDVARIMEQSDILFLPSLSEGLSLVTTEALRSGLAFVASRIPGVEGVIEDGVNGILCEPDLPGAFAAGFKTLIENRPLLERMQQESLARAPSFDAGRMADAYEAALLSIRKVSS